MASLFGAVLRLERAVGRLEPVVKDLEAIDHRVRRLERGAWVLAGMWLALTSGLLVEHFWEAPDDHKPVALEQQPALPAVREVPIPSLAHAYGP